MKDTFWKLLRGSFKKKKNGLSLLEKKYKYLKSNETLYVECKFYVFWIKGYTTVESVKMWFMNSPEGGSKEVNEYPGKELKVLIWGALTQWC